MFEGNPALDVTLHYEGRRMQANIGPHGGRPTAEAEGALYEANELYLKEIAPRCACVVGLPYLVDGGDLPSMPATMTRLGASEGPYVTQERVNMFYDSAETAMGGLDVPYLLTMDSYLGLVGPHSSDRVRDRIRRLTLPTTPAFTTHRPSELPGDLVEFITALCDGFVYSVGDGTEMMIVGGVAAVSGLLGQYMRVFARLVAEERGR